MNINLSIEEYQRMRDSGSLESYLLSNGIPFKDALMHLLSLRDKHLDSLEEQIQKLDEELSRYE